jgi:hypothetical protein
MIADVTLKYLYFVLTRIEMIFGDIEHCGAFGRWPQGGPLQGCS